MDGYARFGTYALGKGARPKEGLGGGNIGSVLGLKQPEDITEQKTTTGKGGSATLAVSGSEQGR